MLILKDVSKSFGDKQILEKISFSLTNHEVVGLIGLNGAGKTTLFKIITSEIPLDEGAIQKSGEVIAYLPQDPVFGNEALEFTPVASKRTSAGVPHSRTRRDETAEEFLNTKLSDPSLKYKVDMALNQVGLKQIDLSQSCKNLSGGQKTKLYLAFLLLSDPTPSILLLDEPTNNLDLKGLEWLTNFVRNFRGSVVLTSHDRKFLDDVTQRTLELGNGAIKEFGGNYSFYREQKLKEERIYLETYKDNLEEVKKLEKLIKAKEDRAAELSKQKRRDNDKFAHTFFMERASKKVVHGKKALEARLERTEKLEKPVSRINYNLGFEGESHPGKLILEVKNLSKSFYSKKVLDRISFAIYGSEHVLISGENGSGKTTLFKIIAGKLESDSGEIILGKNVKIGYFAQETLELKNHKTGFEELQSTGTKETDCYKMAKSLHLEPQDLKKPIDELSRGQIAKLEFTKLLLSRNNLLILDEPTNHLEIETREEIEEALKDYQGAILLASHDRYFIEEIGIDRQFVIENLELKQIT